MGSPMNPLFQNMMGSLPNLPREVRQYAAEQGQDDGGGILGHFKQALGNPAVQMFLMSALANVLGDKKGTTPFMLMNQQRRNQMVDLARQREGRMGEETRLERERDVFAKTKHIGELGRLSGTREKEAMLNARKIAAEGIPGQLDQLLPTLELQGIKFSKHQLDGLRRIEKMKRAEAGFEQIWVDPANDFQRVEPRTPGAIAVDIDQYRQVVEQGRARTPLGKLLEEREKAPAYAEEYGEAIEGELEGYLTENERYIQTLPPEQQPAAAAALFAKKTYIPGGVEMIFGDDGRLESIRQGNVPERKVSIGRMNKLDEIIFESKSGLQVINKYRNILMAGGPEITGIVGKARMTFHGFVAQASSAWEIALVEFLDTERENMRRDIEANRGKPLTATAMAAGSADRKPITMEYFDPDLELAEYFSRGLMYSLARINERSGRLSDPDVRNAALQLGSKKQLAHFGGILVRLSAFEGQAGDTLNLALEERGLEPYREFHFRSTQDLMTAINNPYVDIKEKIKLRMELQHRKDQGTRRKE